MVSVTRASIDFINENEISRELYDCFQMRTLSGEFIRYRGNLDPELTDNTAEYLIRYLLGGKGKEVFPVARKSCYKIGQTAMLSWFDSISDGMSYFPVNERSLNNSLIWDFLNIAVFDGVFRKNSSIDEIKEEIEKIDNIENSEYNEISSLVNRSLEVFKDFGKPRKIGVYFKKETFLENTIVKSGDADLLFEDTLLNFYIDNIPYFGEVEVYKIVCYWLLLRIQDKIQCTSLSKKIKKLALYNPRCNSMLMCNTDDIPERETKIILKKIIGYLGELD